MQEHHADLPRDRLTPVTRGPARTSVEETDAAIEGAQDPSTLAWPSRPVSGPRLLRPFAAVVDAAPRRAGPSSRCRRRAHPRQRPLEGRQRPRLLNYCSDGAGRCRAGRFHGRRIDVTFHEPLGVVGVIVPWNFRCRSPAGVRARTRGRKHRGAQARRDDAADRHTDRRARARGRPARGGVHSDPRQGIRGRGAFRHPPVVRKVASPAAPRSASGSWPAAPTR